MVDKISSKTTNHINQLAEFTLYLQSLVTNWEVSHISERQDMEKKTYSFGALFPGFNSMKATKILAPPSSEGRQSITRLPLPQHFISDSLPVPILTPLSTRKCVCTSAGFSSFYDLFFYPKEGEADPSPRSATGYKLMHDNLTY